MKIKKAIIRKNKTIIENGMWKRIAFKIALIWIMIIFFGYLSIFIIVKTNPHLVNVFSSSDAINCVKGFNGITCNRKNMWQKEKNFVFKDCPVGKSKVNGLYYAKRGDVRPDIYSTAYCNQILRLLKLRFTDKTYRLILNNELSNGTFKSDGEDYKDCIYITYLSRLALGTDYPVNKQVGKALLKYRQNDGSFLFKYATTLQDDEKITTEKKIIYTYMSLYVMKEAEFDISNLSSTIDWLINQFKSSALKDNSILYARLIQSLYLINPDIILSLDLVKNNQFQNTVEMAANQNWDIGKVNDVEGLTILYSLGIIKIPEKYRETIKAFCLNILSDDIDDKQVAYQILSSYTRLNGNLNVKNIELTGQRILSNELEDGGVSNTIYIGTPRETLMVLTIMKAYRMAKYDRNLENTLHELLSDVVEDKEKSVDNGDIYSLVAAIKLMDRDYFNSSQRSKDFLINKMKTFLFAEINAAEYREWFYAIKTLELLDFNFSNNHLPKNYNWIINNIDQYGRMRVTTDLICNEMLGPIIVDGLATIGIKPEDVDKMRTAMQRLSNTGKEDKFTWKKRYYAILALIEMGACPENIDDTLNIVSKLDNNESFDKISETKWNLQFRFQVSNMKIIKQLIDEGQIKNGQIIERGDDLYR